MKFAEIRNSIDLKFPGLICPDGDAGGSEIIEISSLILITN